MKPLENTTIVYDDTCPMCKWYTNQFVRCGVLPNRTPFSEMPENIQQTLDLNRSRHEIPLINTITGEVRYGLDGLMMIFGRLIPMLDKILNSRFFKTLLMPLYKFISYNRRIIVPSKSKPFGFDAAPDFHAGWRLAFIAFTLLLNMGLHHYFAQWVITYYFQGNDIIWVFRIFFWGNILIAPVALKINTSTKTLDSISSSNVAFLVSTAKLSLVWIMLPLLFQGFAFLVLCLMLGIFEWFFLRTLQQRRIF